MIVMFVVVLVALAMVLGLAVAIRHHQLLVQIEELESEIEKLEAKSDLLQRPDYFVSCEIDALIRKRDRIKEKLFF